MSESQGSARLRLSNVQLSSERITVFFTATTKPLNKSLDSLPLLGADVNLEGYFEARAAWCESRHVTLRILFVPEKHVVYSDKIPELRISYARPVLQILSALAPGTRAKCLYPVEALRAHRHQFETWGFRPTRTGLKRGPLWHTTSWCVRCAKKSTYLRSLKRTSFGLSGLYIGDLGVRLEPEREETTVFLSHGTFLPFRRVFENKGFSRGINNRV